MARALIVDNGSKSTRLVAQVVMAAGWTANVVPLSGIHPANGAFDAVILTGTDVPVWSPIYQDELALIRSCAVPLLGICGGLQLIGRAFGVGVDLGPPMIGRTPVRLMPGVPLFSGLPEEVTLFQRHVYRLASVPPGWESIATSRSCEIEGIRHRARALYGMQAHLEFRFEGKSILRNFLEIAQGAKTRRVAATGSIDKVSTGNQPAVARAEGPGSWDEE